MKLKLHFLAMVLLSEFSQAADPISAADLLDEAIWWPGDFGQVCLDSGQGSFAEPPLMAYGTLSALEYSLSQKRIEQLKARRAEIVPEIIKRLKDFDWAKPRAARPAPKTVGSVAKQELGKLDPDGPGPGPWKPMNADALNALMLRIIEALDVAEALPELRRFEADLDELISTTLKDVNNRPWNEPQKEPPPLLPISETGMSLGWSRGGSTDRFQGEAWKAWRSRTFDALVFQREILGVALGIIHRKGYAPLQQTMIGRLAQIRARDEGRDMMQHHQIKTAADLDRLEAKSYLVWDDALGQVMPRQMAFELPGTPAILTEARLIIDSYIHRDAPAAGSEGSAKLGLQLVTDGTALLAETLKAPGSWSQMCAMPPPISADVPMPALTQLASRHFGLGGEVRLRLQAHRDLVIPVLKQTLAKLEVRAAAVSEADSMPSEPSSGQLPGMFGPLIFETLEVLAAVECLPDLLRLEQVLEAGIAKYSASPTLVAPALLLDSPSGVEGSKDARSSALNSWRIYQRELLGLIAQLLEGEGYPPFEKSLLQQARTQANKEATDKALAKAKSRDDLPWKLDQAAYFDEETKRWAVPSQVTLRVTVPYSPELRADLRGIAERFLKEVPAKQCRAAGAMILNP